MNWETSCIDAIALYGSIVRGDNDQLSDRDVILVARSESDLVRAKHVVEEKGHSCASYTWRKLRRLSRKKALFLQHLKEESLIIRDNNEQLRSLLHHFEPASDYSKEIEDTKRLIASTQYCCNTFYGSS